MFHLHFFIDKGFLVISHETAADAKKGIDWLMLYKLASGVAGPRDASDVGRALSLSLVISFAPQTPLITGSILRLGREGSTEVQILILISCNPKGRKTSFSQSPQSKSWGSSGLTGTHPWGLKDGQFLATSPPPVAKEGTTKSEPHGIGPLMTKRREK